MILPIILFGPAVIGTIAMAVVFAEGKRDNENDERIKAAEQQAKRAEARERQRRKHAQVDRLISKYGLPTSTKPELATWAAAGDAGVKRIEREIAAGNSDTATNLRDHENRCRELLELRDEVLQVRFGGRRNDG